MKIEICLEKLETALIANRLGVHRIELCSALDLGGLTPSPGIIEACADGCFLDVFVMIRPRGGGFVYNEGELMLMKKDINFAGKAGAKGVVFGCLTDDFLLDEYQNRKLFDFAKSLDLGVTFHRAFDFCISPDKALEQLMDWGFDSILTSGQKATAIEGLKNIKQWVNKSQGNIQIMAGSGVIASNAKELVDAGVDALHFTARKKVVRNLDFGMGDEYLVDVDKIKAVMANFYKN